MRDDDWGGPVQPCPDCGMATTRTPANGGWCEDCRSKYKDKKDAAPAPSYEALARMLAAPTSFLSRFTKEQLDEIVRLGGEAPEICGTPNQVRLNLGEAKAFRAVVMGDHFDTKAIDSGLKKIDALIEMNRQDEDEDF